jgi:cytochrome c2
LALGAGWLRAIERQMQRQAGRRIVKEAWLGVLVALLIGLSSCKQEVERTAAALTGGEPSRGKQVIRQYGCGSCHVIPGIREANALVGPSLEQIASRMYIAGVLPNTPENMLRWLQNPPAVDPLTAMPNLGVTEADARDMAGYLYTLR